LGTRYEREVTPVPNDEGTQETDDRPSKLNIPETPEDVMKVWKKKLEELPKLDQVAVDKRLREMVSIQIPDTLLLPEGYIKLFGQLQHLRGEALKIASLVNKHHKTRVAAMKSMQAIFQGRSTRKSVGEREAEAESWLIYVKRSFVDVDVLNDFAKDTVDSINRATADAVQQLKSINQFGVPTQLLDASQAVNMSQSWDEVTESENTEDE
jgi:hypothetical protein